jgi:hypothetical protein
MLICWVGTWLEEEDKHGDGADVILILFYFIYLFILTYSYLGGVWVNSKSLFYFLFFILTFQMPKMKPLYNQLFYGFIY